MEILFDIIGFIVGILILAIIIWLMSNPFSRIARFNEMKNDPDFKYVREKLSSIDWGESVVSNKTKRLCGNAGCSKPIYLQHLDASILIELLRERGTHKMETFCVSHAQERIPALRERLADYDYIQLLEKAKKIHVVCYKK